MHIRVKLGNVGDTIVEVLIAIAILSVVLGGAYAIVNRSHTNIRQAQEHTEALKLGEEQLERLKQLGDNGGIDTSGGNIYVTGVKFCVNIVGGNLKKETGAACQEGTAPVIYTKEIEATAVGTTGSYNFDILVSWDGIHGGRDTVPLDYRLDK